MGPTPLRVGFVTGTTPDKWARAWREQRREPLDLVPLTEAEQERVVRDGDVDMALVRLPVDREGLHLVSLYEEVAVVVAGREHVVAATEADESVRLADLADEQLVLPHRSGLDAVGATAGLAADERAGGGRDRRRGHRAS